MALTTPAGGGQDFDSGEDMSYIRSSAVSGIYDDGGGDSSSAYSTDDEEISEPSLSMEQRLRLAKLLVVNLSSSHEWTHGIGDMFLNEDIWEVRIYFDAQEPLERKLCTSDVNYLNTAALMETQGFSVYDSSCHIENPGLGEQGLEIVVSDAELQMIKRENKDTMVLDLLVRACPRRASEFEIQHSHKPYLSPIAYEEPVVFDPSDPPILVVDQQGVVFESQCNSSTTTHAPAICTQESRNLNANLKAVYEEEEEEGYQGFDVYEDSDACPCDNEVQIGKYSYYMSRDGDVEMREGKRHREEEEEDGK
ncbi:hypothetical protein D1007_48546 [Hordeum vulgare]|nr:hypothetical protein D1007_48546 [Hordeum vulgare]